MPGPEEAGPSRQTKRKRHEVTPPFSRPPSKRRPASKDRPSATYAPLPNDSEILETKKLLPSESSDDADEDIEIDTGDRDRKPVRMLNDFYVYEELEDERVMQPPDLYDHQAMLLYAVGIATPYYENTDIRDEEHVTVRVRTTPIRNLYVQYLEYDRLIWIETDHAWYVLCEPAMDYKERYTAFANKEFSLQLLCSMAADPKATLDDFHYALEHEILGREYRKSDVMGFMSLLSKFAREESLSFLHVPLIHAVRKECDLDGEMMPRPSAPRTRRRRPAIYNDSPRHFNLDEHALRPEPEQATRTCLTPFIAHLKRKFHPSWAIDSKVVHWERDDDVLPEPSDERKEAEHRHLLDCVRRARDDGDDTVRVHRRSSDGDVTSVLVGSETYHIGDVVVFFPTSSWNNKKPDPLPKRDKDIAIGTRLEDLGFWFGTLISIKEPPKSNLRKRKSVGHMMGHILWFEHASRTFVGTGADPRELTMWPRKCDDQPLAAIHGKVGVHMLYESGVVPSLPETCSYFCRFEYTEGLGYRSLPAPAPAPFDIPVCTNCSLKGLQALDDDDSPLKIDLGFRIHAEMYHVDDFCLFHSSDKPSSLGSVGLSRVGQIRSFSVERGQLELREFGRIADFASVLPNDVIDRSWDARQLFAGPFVDVRLEDVVGPCQVLRRDCVPNGDILSYIAASSTNFWAVYKSESESLDLTSSDDLVEVEPYDIQPCAQGCVKNRADRDANRELFCSVKKGRKCLDICAGAGLLGRGLSDGSNGVYDVTHAVEIRPSAAQTLRDAHPRTKVYMTCVSLLLEASVKWHNGDIGAYSDLKATDGNGLPDAPPQPRDGIDAIAAGIPCQPHSELNAFKRRKDKKADLMLSFLSWVHFIRPNHIILENVKGFMNHAVDSVPLGTESTRGSGLRFVVNVLMRLGYQVQFCLLNAVHYGAPQRRVQFILFAAKIGYPLMQVPKPTHYHRSEAANLTYSYFNAEGHDVKLSALKARQYLAPLRCVSVWDAIGDLMPWDLDSSDSRIDARRAEDGDGLLKLREHLAAPRGEIAEFVQPSTEEGMVGPQDDVYTYASLYAGPPRSTFQEMMRSMGENVRDLQHFSLRLGKNMIHLVRLVPLIPRADWKDIPEDLVERLADPPRRKKEWRKGTIGRIDKDDVFQTIVTDVHPLAKQGWVLHPYCRRILSVRELARAQGVPDHFHIYAPVDERYGVITRSGVIEMHRQLGNAVPLPLATALGRAMLEADFEAWYALPEHERLSLLLD